MKYDNITPLTFEQLVENFAYYDLCLIQIGERYCAEFDDHNPPWFFNTLDEVCAFEAGIDFACVFVNS